MGRTARPRTLRESTTQLAPYRSPCVQPATSPRPTTTASPPLCMCGRRHHAPPLQRQERLDHRAVPEQDPSCRNSGALRGPEGTWAPAYLSMPALWYMLCNLPVCLPLCARNIIHAADRPPCLPTDRPNPPCAHPPPPRALIAEPPPPHTHTHPAEEAGSQKAEERPRKTWEADGAGLHGVRLLRGR